MANSEYNYIPTYIRRTINNRPKDVVTASYWNELFNLLITQGDHTAEELGNILNYFSTRLVGAESEIAESAEAIANIREVFRINVTYSNGAYSADKTFAEIKAAYDAGQLPYVVLTGGTLDFVYTLAYFSVPDGTGQDFVDFERYLIGEDTLETETLRVYSYTTDSGSNVVKRIDEFKMPTSLKNPNALTFTGGATGSYDGSEPKTVDIPVIPYEVINKNTAARHSHDNKTVLDGITAEKVTEWDSKNSITDSGGYFTSDTVEGALQEIGAELAGGGGEDGATFTPSVSADGTLSWTNNKGLTNPDPVNITGPQGERGPQGPAGATGAAGRDGADGTGIQSVEQTATSTEDGGANIITVTKTDGTSSTFTVKNGSKGSTGATGAAGRDGYTPVRGTDYWTADDIAAIQSYINEKAAALQSKSITDSGGHFTSDTVEGALQEIGAELAGINTLLGSGIQISFTIDGDPFSAVSGETWKEWIGGYSRVISEISGLTIYCFSDDGIIFADEAGVNALGLNDVWVHGNETIVSGATYAIIPCGG